MAVSALAQEKFWINKSAYDAAERSHFERLYKESRVSGCSEDPASGSLANEVAKARQHIKKGLQCLNNISGDSAVPSQDLMGRLTYLENDNRELHATVKALNKHITDLEAAIKKLEITVSGPEPAPYLCICPAKPPSEKASPPAEDDDDDVDLFGSDSEGEDAEAAKIREERLAAYAAKKSKKPAVIAKSSIVLDVKPWDDETDMKAMEAEVRKITCDGLLWGAAKLVPLAYKIHKLQISCVIEDDKVSVDWLTEEIEKNDEIVQSVDIAAFNKI
ncbi:probable elongation factor 1-delta isoform X2 [Microplitis demolitor]|uniref:probable elongation factor 1-delta isoform X2 n=1 Tax=Microplitis demolitor TaxID=69319 RepID=UPI0004CD535A|nr:probable elongation factor 1-delta isoform X2 [Microplitis demolitor]